MTLGKINANCLWLSFLANKTINIFLIEILWIYHFLLFTLLSQNQLTELNTFLLHLPFYPTPLASLALLHTLCTDWACSFRHCFSLSLPSPLLFSLSFTQVPIHAYTHSYNLETLRNPHVSSYKNRIQMSVYILSIPRYSLRLLGWGGK